MIIKFTIYGNQEDPRGNAVPYTRVVHRALWTKAGRRYNAWKQYVQGVFSQAMRIRDAARLWSIYQPLAKKPLKIEKCNRAKMNIKIFWRDARHGDPDNVWKGIADALFQNDKYLKGSFDFDYSDSRAGRVEVKIKIERK